MNEAAFEFPHDTFQALRHSCIVELQMRQYAPILSNLAELS